MNGEHRSTAEPQPASGAMAALDRFSLERFEPLIGAKALDRLHAKAKRVRDQHVVNISSTHYGGGVAELLTSSSLIMNDLGIKCGWRVIQGRPDFFSITKKIHNALQGADINLSDLKIQIYEEVLRENAMRTHLDHDLVIIHDPQPLGLIKFYRRRAPWVWRCHSDLSNPNPELWKYLAGFIENYDAVIYSIPEYAQSLAVPQLFFMPAINPFSATNQDLGEDEIEDRLAHYDVPTDLPIVAQVSRFDHWKDPKGVIEAFRLARRKVDCTLVLLGNMATDDPEGQELFESLLESREERIIILSCQDSSLVNALQRRAAIVVQKSLREGFGLTVTEAMWKGAAVIGGDVGGIRHQIEDGVNGMLVSNVEETAERMVQLLKDEALRRRLGAAARHTVIERFLMPRLIEQYLELFDSFRASYRLEHPPPASS
jgi:trehalose synthase